MEVRPDHAIRVSKATCDGAAIRCLHRLGDWFSRGPWVEAPIDRNMSLQPIEIVGLISIKSQQYGIACHEFFHVSPAVRPIARVLVHVCDQDIARVPCGIGLLEVGTNLPKNSAGDRNENSHENGDCPQEDLCPPSQSLDCRAGVRRCLG